MASDSGGNRESYTLQLGAWWLGVLGIEALTLGNRVWVRQTTTTAPLLAHEGTHVRQFREAGGLWRGLWRWLALLAQYGYDAHPWEVQARAVEAKTQRYLVGKSKASRSSVQRGRQRLAIASLFKVSGKS